MQYVSKNSIYFSRCNNFLLKREEHVIIDFWILALKRENIATSLMLGVIFSVQFMSSDPAPDRGK